MEEEKQEKQEIKEKVWYEETIEQLESEIKKVNAEKVNPDNVTYLNKLVDDLKDIENIKYWKEKIKMYRDGYNNYNDFNDGSYGRRGVRGTGPYSRYRDGEYGRRGVPGSGRRYRGEEMLDEMNYSYGAYSESSEYGNYNGASTKELEKMLDCNVALIEHLKKNAKSQEEIQVIEQKVQEMSRL